MLEPYCLLVAQHIQGCDQECIKCHEASYYQSGNHEPAMFSCHIVHSCYSYGTGESEMVRINKQCLETTEILPMGKSASMGFPSSEMRIHLHFVSLTSSMMERMDAMDMEKHSEPF